MYMGYGEKYGGRNRLLQWANVRQGRFGNHTKDIDAPREGISKL
jgi:hypothetical protein